MKNEDSVIKRIVLLTRGEESDKIIYRTKW